MSDIIEIIAYILSALGDLFRGVPSAPSGPTRKRVRCQNCGHKNIVWSNDLPEAQICASCGAALGVKFGTTAPFEIPAPKLNGEYAGFWMRFGASIVDCIFANLPIIIFLLLLSLAPNPNEQAGFVLFLTPFLLLPYHWLFTGLKGQTLGKMFFHVKVVNAQGKKPGLGRAFLREVLGKLISTVGLCIGFFWIAGDWHKQGWHDKIASTYVIKVKANTNKKDKA